MFSSCLAEPRHAYKADGAAASRNQLLENKVGKKNVNNALALFKFVFQMSGQNLASSPGKVGQHNHVRSALATTSSQGPLVVFRTDVRNCTRNPQPPCPTTTHTKKQITKMQGGSRASDFATGARTRQATNHNQNTKQHGAMMNTTTFPCRNLAQAVDMPHAQRFLSWSS